jgi:hypothetical protein
VRARAFRILSRHDFFGGGGGISSVPWWSGDLCHSSFLVLYLSEIRSLRWATHLIASDLGVQYDEALDILKDETAWEYREW